MSSQPSGVVAEPVAIDGTRLKSVVEKGVKFHIKTGNQKWACTLLDRNAQYVTFPGKSWLLGR
jgi:hypothetical protein